MAQPNVAREPSMEEILASIRRIIESNDPTTDAAGLQSTSEAYTDDEIDAIEEISFDPEQVANDAGLPLQPQAVAAPELVAASAERSLSLADVAARVRAASVRQQEAHRAAGPRVEEPVARAPEPASVISPFPTRTVVPEVSAPPEPLAMPALRPALEEASFKTSDETAGNSEAEMPEAAAFDDERRSPEIETAQTAPAAAEFTAPEPAAPDLREDTSDLSRLPVQMAASADAPLAGIAGLLSEAAGAQVAKSFGELADVFDGLERRSVEEMAQDMLRPMLQEWLDDNLPTLVERLVREEIERVARGPRR
ncbi:hypothetical protein SAMN03159496_03598 [Rhizobium sp. NFR07]|uniref:PopZ family protein n=1 Tax=Rhizobium sp. NFR07 TaxID=1566262 RepID=UPI0008E2E575|nr:DUF2497 domain-containing protein [Rhizobium sp. NFR07]SFB42601.1 hypothetical protein SAMN03159496_03598 [Rhizobium sp. NFR07]